ncbi:HAD family hydrolase [Methanobrevibacter sp.]|uniref:HAD family hydrolase n=1 Tax=Methanobrevibacter sp. TaxID=66852 RepID=UPI0025D67E7F|nr:HAD family hydrolase [Methanobrevibacter sp.]MBQ2666783.1 HAD family hydrolase [Methanobrevibacter sp.]
MKKFAIFDFDGTLFDSIHDVMICLNEALSRHGFPTLTHDEYVKRLGGNIDEIVSLVLKDNNTAENIERVKRTYGEIYDASPKDRTLPFEGMRDVLVELQNKGTLLAIHSNRGTDSIKYFTEKYFQGIDFVAIEGHDPDYPSKPNPYAVKMMEKKFKVAQEEQIYIGDSSTDIKTAQNAEIDCLIVRWGYGFKEDYENGYPLEIIENPSQILKYF